MCVLRKADKENLEKRVRGSIPLRVELLGERALVQGAGGLLGDSGPQPDWEAEGAFGSFG